MRRNAFTLIELLIVLGVIALLMAILVPSMSSAARAAKVRETQARIDALAAAVREYHRIYGAYPPACSPHPTVVEKTDGSTYPPQYLSDGSQAPSLMYSGGWLGQHYGGKFLAYFLMGPRGTGWHRPRTTAGTDPDYACRNITAEWDVPDGLVDFYENRRVSQGKGCGDSEGTPPNHGQNPVFVDGFGLSGNNGGAIGYIVAYTLIPSGESFQWNVHGMHDAPFHSAFYSDCRSHPSYPGDGDFQGHERKIFAQCPYDFALLSPGADQKFGYRVTIMAFGGGYMKGSWAYLDRGLCDDIGNFPIQ